MKEEDEIFEIRELSDDVAAEHPAAGIRFLSHSNNPVEPVVHNEISNFRKWLRQQRPDINIEFPGGAKKLDLRSGDIWMPLAVIATDVGVPVYLNLVSSYLYDRLKGALATDRCRVKLKVQFESKGKRRLLNFDGDARSFQELVVKIDLDQFLK